MIEWVSTHVNEGVFKNNGTKKKVKGSKKLIEERTSICRSFPGPLYSVNQRIHFIVRQEMVKRDDPGLYTSDCYVLCCCELCSWVLWIRLGSDDDSD